MGTVYLYSFMQTAVTLNSFGKPALINKIHGFFVVSFSTVITKAY